MAAGTLAEYTAGVMVSIAHDKMVLMLLLQAQASTLLTEAGHVVSLYHMVMHVRSTF